MSVLRRISAVAAAAVLGATLFTPAAHADWTFYRTDPHVGACWTKVTAYGGVYQVENLLLNGTSTAHTARVQVHRPGVGFQSDQTYVAAPGEWKVGAVASVSIYSNDDFRYYLDGSQAVGIPANGIPYYMTHCKVTESPSTKVRQALSYGLAQLDAIYVGCAAGTYRYGTVPSTTLNHDGRTCGQTRVYKQPAGVKGFDCSGLIVKMFQNAGVPFNWHSSTAVKDGVPSVPKSQIRVGDLLAKYGHVAVYLGDGDGDGVASVLEATPKWQNPDGTWTGVVISDATSYLNSSSYTAHRVPGV
ncbi:NlpC/P60 family protein [Catellatospora sichuanensis]|uniref:NlpC/P60 family protein n=1 Tax=Catellatospora sichuanensis TaxID=1969805 RepID=UPI00118211B2|nr:NlpC/P60 family protein [Catellatospora sichuanensis]